MQKRYIDNQTQNKGTFVLLSLVLAVVMCISYVSALACFSNLTFDFSSGKDTSDGAVSQTVSETPEVSHEPLPIEYEFYDELTFKNTKYKNSEVRNGSLAIVKSAVAAGTEIGESSLVQSDVLNIYANMTKNAYGLSGAGLTMYGDAMRAIDSWLVWFNETMPSNGLCIESAYCTSQDVSVDRKPADLHSGFSVKLMMLKTQYNLADDEFSPLREQSHIYGIIQRFPEDKQTYTGSDVDYSVYRYVGLAHSDYIQRYKLSLEEYVDKIKTEKVIEFKSRFEANTAYVVYYVPVSDQSNSTEIPLPNGGENYQISGDGSDGFIVTVKISI